MKARSWLNLGVVLICLIFTAMLFIPTAGIFAEDVTVVFPDKNLEAAIREAIGKPDGDIYAADVLKVFVLDVSGRNIENLTGLQLCIKLAMLTLNDNRISDISPLTSLTKLQALHLDNNRISDINPLVLLNGITILSFDNNQVTDISSLASLTNLDTLGFSYNEVSDISPLASLTNLQYLWITNNRISDISPLSGLTKLKWLYLENNRITDIYPLVANTGLSSTATVFLNENPLSEESVNTYLPQLKLRGIGVFYFKSSVTTTPVQTPAPTSEAPDTISKSTVTTIYRPKYSVEPETGSSPTSIYTLGIIGIGVILVIAVVFLIIRKPQARSKQAEKRPRNHLPEAIFGTVSFGVLTYLMFESATPFAPGADLMGVIIFWLFAFIFFSGCIGLVAEVIRISNQRHPKGQPAEGKPAEAVKHFDVVNLRIRLGIYGMTRDSGSPLDIFLDDRPLKDINWGEQGEMLIPSGKHEITIVPKAPKNVSPVPLKMSFVTGNEESLGIFCSYIESDGWSMIIEEAGNLENSKDALKYAYNATYFIGGINVVLGSLMLVLISWLSTLEELKDIVDVSISLSDFTLIIIGLVFIVLGVFIQHRSRIALLSAMALVVIHSLLVVIRIIPTNTTVIIVGAIIILINIAFLQAMALGLGALKELRKQSKHTALR